MTRRAIRNTGLGISLFPFLAVLICTVGALIMLLVMLMKQARANAEEVGREMAMKMTDSQKEQQEQLRVQTEDENWRSEILVEQRDELQQQVGLQRAKLAHLEQHIRDLDQQWNSLQAQALEIAKLRSTESADVQPLEEEKQRIEEQLALAREQLEQVRQQIAEAPRSYAIIPYPGPNGTTRRPIYIECTERGVILQPENILLNEKDFAEPLGPGNPLDAAIRTVYAYQKQAFAQEQFAPYPLLIVRSKGVGAYAAARAAMSSWEDEFGYELVDEEMDLSYPAADPGLSSALQEAIQAARQRQEIRRMAMPASRGSGSYVVSPHHGGLVSVDGGDDADEDMSGDSGMSSDGPGRGVGNGSGGMGNGRGGGGSSPPDVADSGTNEGHASGNSSERHAANSSGGNQSRSGGQSNGNAQYPNNGATDGPGGPLASGSAFGAGAFAPPSMASTRGNDWALRKKTARATGYRRPVRVICRSDALVLVPEPLSNDKPRVFNFAEDATTTIDQFVKALHQRTDLWGLPPLNGFWRPQLVVQVEQGGEARYELLEQLLQNSGLELKRETR